jgi:DNA-directed RNA polymerase specialized sigma24 family protein
LIRAWLRKYDVQDSDADDLVQEVLLAVSKDLDKFEHRGQPGAFRGWLKAILVNKTWKAFCRVALDGAPPDVVAEEMGISRNSVIVAKCRVLSRLRQESEGLIESSSGFFANS